MSTYLSAIVLCARDVPSLPILREGRSLILTDRSHTSLPLSFCQQTIQAGAESASTLDAEISSTVQHLVALIARQRQSKSFAHDPDKTVGIAFLSRDYRGNDRLCCHNATAEGTELASDVFNALFSKPRENSARRSSSSINHPEINIATIGAEYSPSEDGA